MAGLLRVACIVFVGWLAWHWLFKPDTWWGCYETNASPAVQCMKLGSQDDCERWLTENRTDSGQNYNHECGSNCKPSNSGLGAYVCKETFGDSLL
jgi:hypothetical protein